MILRRAWVKVLHDEAAAHQAVLKSEEKSENTTNSTF